MFEGGGRGARGAEVTEEGEGEAFFPSEDEL